MTNQELLEEIRENRREIRKLHQDFYIFKGKALGFILALNVLFGTGVYYKLQSTMEKKYEQEIQRRVQGKQTSSRV